jgi:putative ABC transport system permease protein
MIKQLFKQLWTERRHNNWLLLELIVVVFFLLLMTDFLWVKLKNYIEPKGFDIENTYLLKLKEIDPIAPHYVNPEQITLSPVEELNRIIERIKLYPDVENVSVSIYAAPYSMGGYWNSLYLDTIQSPGIRCRQVTPSYFDVFRILTPEGKPIRAEVTGYQQIILTEDAAERFYHTAAQAIGKEVYTDNNPDTGNKPSRITAVTNRMKRQDFFPYENAYFLVLSTPDLERFVEHNSVSRLDLCVRIRPGSAQHFDNNFVPEMGDRLKENNLYVGSVVSSCKLRDNEVGKMIREDIQPMTYVMLFVLITVFMGVFGAFWLRIHQRRSEIAIRMAMGADKGMVRRSTVFESLCLVALSILPAYLVYLNLLSAGILDTYRLPFTFGRTVIALLSTLLIASAIVAGGTCLPASRAANHPPARGLKGEPGE